MIELYPARLGFGMTARPDPDPGLAVIGPELVGLGYEELWANDGRGRSGLRTLATAGGHAEGLDLCLGVAPLSERTPQAIADEVRAEALPQHRLTIGVGTGSGSSLAQVRAAVAELRRLLPRVRLPIAALGPLMCRLGGEAGDVVLLNWSFPERIAWTRQRIAEGAALAERPMPRVACYVRTAIGPDASERLLAEADRYRGRPGRPYTRLFAAQGAPERGVPGIAAADPEQVPALLAPYRAELDSCVVRALPTGDSGEDWLAVAGAAR